MLWEFWAKVIFKCNIVTFGGIKNLHCLKMTQH
jgi:hypothetical protein